MRTMRRRVSGSVDRIFGLISYYTRVRALQYYIMYVYNIVYVGTREHIIIECNPLGSVTLHTFHAPTAVTGRCRICNDDATRVAVDRPAAAACIILNTYLCNIYIVDDYMTMVVLWCRVVGVDIEGRRGGVIDVITKSRINLLGKHNTIYCALYI